MIDKIFGWFNVFVAVLAAIVMLSVGISLLLFIAYVSPLYDHYLYKGVRKLLPANKP